MCVRGLPCLFRTGPGRPPVPWQRLSEKVLATQIDHFQNTRARLLARLKDLEIELNETRELLDANDKLSKLVGTGVLPKATAPTPIDAGKSSGGVRTLQNRNITALVRDYIDKVVKEDEAVNVPSLTKDYLIREHGVKGKERNINAQVHVILRKETVSNERKPARLFHVKGAGYFKRKKTNGEESVKAGTVPVSS